MTRVFRNRHIATMPTSNASTIFAQRTLSARGRFWMKTVLNRILQHLAAEDSGFPARPSGCPIVFTNIVRNVIHCPLEVQSLGSDYFVRLHTEMPSSAAIFFNGASQTFSYNS